jgi:glycosyltransferase involved in cell wall biosynthesis
MPVISVVCPVFNESGCLDELYRRLTVALLDICESHELILVDDGSSDGSWEMIAALSARDSRVHGVRFSRNFGHHLSISAGIDYARGDWVVVMDSDLQDLPESIPELYARATEGYDIVLACRSIRRDSWFKRTTSHLFHKAYAFFTDTVYDAQQGVFRIMSRRVVGVLRQMREHNRNFGVLVDWAGFRRSRIFVEHAARYAGKTKYTLAKQIDLALHTILSVSDRPLMYATYMGLAMTAFAVLFCAFLVAIAIAGRSGISGYGTLAAAIFFTGGLTIFTVGMVGIYVGRILTQVQGRPLYVVAETTGYDSDLPPAAFEDATRSLFTAE